MKDDGDLGSLRLSSWFEPYGTVQLAPFGEPYERAAHVLEILEAASQSMASHRPVAIQSDFMIPEPMEWAK